ncbi:MAG: hypothetical protein ACXV2C_01175 [Candidatus Bathyarchaeia archaeon]
MWVESSQDTDSRFYLNAALNGSTVQDFVSPINLSDQEKIDNFYSTTKGHGRLVLRTDSGAIQCHLSGSPGLLAVLYERTVWNPEDNLVHSVSLSIKDLRALVKNIVRDWTYLLGSNDCRNFVFSLSGELKANFTMHRIDNIRAWKQATSELYLSTDIEKQIVSFVTKDRANSFDSLCGQWALAEGEQVEKVRLWAEEVLHLVNLLNDDALTNNQGSLARWFLENQTRFASIQTWGGDRVNFNSMDNFSSLFLSVFLLMIKRK